MPEQDTPSAPEPAPKPAPNSEHQAVLYRWERGPYGRVVRSHHVETWNWVSIFVSRWASEEEKPLGGHRLSRAGRTYKLDASQLMDTGRVWSEDAEAWFGRTPQPPEGADLRSPWEVAEGRRREERFERALADAGRAREAQEASTAALRLRCAAWEAAHQELDAASAASEALGELLQAEAAEAAGEPAGEGGRDWLVELLRSEEHKRVEAAARAERAAFDALDAALVEAEQARADARQAHLDLRATSRSGREAGTDGAPPTPRRALGRGEARRAARAAGALTAALGRLGSDATARTELITRALDERGALVRRFYGPNVVAMLEAALHDTLPMLVPVLLDDAERAADEPDEQAVPPAESEEPGTTPEEAPDDR
jgi:hypothetical protein